MEINKTSVDLYDEYLKGDSWKCEKSPTKAHYWQEQKHDNEESIFVCKHCEERRKMWNTWSGALARMAKKLNKRIAISPDSF